MNSNAWSVVAVVVRGRCVLQLVCGFHLLCLPYIILPFSFTSRLEVCLHHEIHTIIFFLFFLLILIIHYCLFYLSITVLDGFQ